MARDMIAMAYWAGWANAPVPDYDFWLLPCFGVLKYDNGSYWTDYSASGNFPYPSDRGPYVTWNSWQNAHGNCGAYARTLLSYGGDANPDFRTSVAENRQLDFLAGELVASVDKYYFCGLELDVEDWWTRTREVNLAFATNLVTVVNTAGPLLQKNGKPVVITVGPTSANASGGDSYSGTMIPFYQSPAMAFVAQINIMCYDITYADGFRTLDALLAQYVQAGVPPEKLSPGIKPVWGIGLDRMPATPSAAQYVKAMLDGFGLPR